MTMRKQYDMVIQYALIRKSDKAYEAILHFIIIQHESSVANGPSILIERVFIDGMNASHD
jgi:hypothetical protein